MGTSVDAAALRHSWDPPDRFEHRWNRRAGRILDPNGQERRGPKADVAGQHPARGLDLSRRHDHQRDRDGDFHDDERVPQPLPDPIGLVQKSKRVGLEPPRLPTAPA